MYKCIYTVESDGKTAIAITRMFGSTGPYVMEGQRLDMLNDVTILLDESTRTTHETGTSTTKGSSSVGRAVVGGVLAGGAGAIVGSMTGKRTSNINTKTTERINVKLTVRLTFSNGKYINVVVTNLTDYHWLLHQSSLTPATDEELQEQRLQGESDARVEAIEKQRWEVVDKEVGEAPKPDNELENFFLFGGIGIGLFIGIVAGISTSSFLVFLISSIAIGGAGVLISIMIESSHARRWHEHRRMRQELYDKLYPK